MAYDNSARQARAAQTHSRVLTAAHGSFLREGYAATTIRGVAESAGVSQETVYKTFGNKAGLLKAVYDVTLAGDEEPISMADRPEFHALMAAGSPEAAATTYGQLAGWLSERAGPLLQVVLAGRGGDPELEAFAATIDAERLFGAQMTVRQWSAHGWLRSDLSPESARDLLWTYNSPAVHLLLMQRAWTTQQYQDWLATALLATILDSGAVPGSRPATR